MSVARQVRRVVILFCFFMLAVSVRGALAQKPAPSLDALERMNDAIDALTRKVWPSVVQIAVTSYGVTREKDAAEETTAVLGRQQSIGSGFVIDADGYIVTNAHVVANAQRIQVLLSPEKTLVLSTIRVSPSHRPLAVPIQVSTAASTGLPILMTRSALANSYAIRTIPGACTIWKGNGM